LHKQHLTLPLGKGRGAVNLNVATRNGKTYLYIEKSYRNAEGKPRKKNIKAIGYVDDLTKQYPDPIAHFREVARQMTEEERADKRVNMQVNMEDILPEGAVGTRNVGYMLPLKIYHELGIDKYLKGKAQSEAFEYNTNAIMTLLAMSRILAPGSKKRAFEGKGRYFERFDFTLDDVYHSLGHFDKVSMGLQRHIHENVRMKYGSDTTIIYYDVTNYYFEIKQPDEFRKYGLSKEKRKRPVVQMGLAMDRDGVPLRYELFAGNKLDKETFRSVIGGVRKEFGTGRIVVVADMGIITGDNIYYLVGGKPEKPANGYVFSFSVRGGAKDFKEYVLDARGYAGKDGKALPDDPDFMVKERMIAREIEVTMQNGSKAKKKVYEKQVVFWSKKHSQKSRAERAEILKKAEALLSDPAKYTKATSYGAAAYVNNLEYDKDTGEVINKGKQLTLNLQKIEDDEQYDGYYAIVTSELDMPCPDIVNTYHGLWEIEETFRITKSDLSARPVFVREPAHINAHFLICFIALVILRLIQKKTSRAYSAEAIIDCLNKIECILEYENIYLFGYRSSISDLLGTTFGIDFTKRRLRLADIKYLSAVAKKS